MTQALLSVADVARLTGLSAYTIRQAISDGELPAAKLRNRIRVSPDDLAAWVDENRVKPEVGDLITGAFPSPAKLGGTPSGGYRQAARARRKAA